MTHRLSIILSKCYNKKFREGFIKYLASLDFAEFDKLFQYYMNVISLLLWRYQKDKIRFFSIKLFKYKILNYKYNQLYYMFSESNFQFVIIINENMKIENRRREKLISELDDVQKSIESLYNHQLLITLPILSKQDLIDFSVLIIDNIYLKDELKKLLDEVKEFKKY